MDEAQTQTETQTETHEAGASTGFWGEFHTVPTTSGLSLTSSKPLNAHVQLFTTVFYSICSVLVR